MGQENTPSNQSGIVSILSVIFFVILITIMAVSFLRIVTDEQEQVIQDDLSKGALAAARSGVEDAKRAILYCQSLSGGAQINCYNELRNTSCPGMFAGTIIPGALGLQKISPDNSIRVGATGPSNNNNQRYTCVTLTQNTPNYVGKLSTGLGELIPLRATGSFDRLRFSWHQTSIDGTNPAIPTSGSGIISTSDNPRDPEWKVGTARYIAVPRLQLVQFVPGADLLSQQDSSSGTYLIPRDGGGLSTVDINGAVLNLNSIPNKRSTINCNNAVNGYECSATLNLNFARPANAQYYLLVKSQYGTPNYMLELLNGGTPVSFDNVQPIVDSTGVTANVYKRVLSRVSYQSDTFLTTNALEGGMSVCKNFFVTLDSFSNPCAALLPVGSGVPSSGTPGGAL